jgi:hypothetical protein
MGSDMADGWLFKIVIPGVERDTRRMTSWWAVWHRDQSSALDALKRQIGDYKPADAQELSEQQLRVMGLYNAGDLKNVTTEFVPPLPASLEG